jgi:predicted lipoprotein with Yx(FWY)xxD motif
MRFRSTTGLVIGLLALSGPLVACSSSGSSSVHAGTGSAGAAPTTSAATATSAAAATPAASPTTGAAGVTPPAAGASGAHTSRFANLPGPAANAFTVSVAKLPSNEGLALIGPNGHTLYLSDKDQGTTSACTGACATNWPALMSTGMPTLGPDLNPALLGTAPSGQVTYNDHLLYSFAGDHAPGDANGYGKPGWHIVSPAGTGMNFK